MIIIYLHLPKLLLLQSTLLLAQNYLNILNLLKLVFNMKNAPNQNTQNQHKNNQRLFLTFSLDSLNINEITLHY